MNIGEKIRFFRERKSLSQAQMSERLGMSVQGYGNIERGETDVSYSRIEHICKELGIMPETLIGFSEGSDFFNSSGNYNTNYHLKNNQNLHFHADQTLLHENEILKMQNQFLAETSKLLEKRISDLEKLLNALSHKP